MIAMTLKHGIVNMKFVAVLPTTCNIHVPIYKAPDKKKWRCVHQRHMRYTLHKARKMECINGTFKFRLLGERTNCNRQRNNINTQSILTTKRCESMIPPGMRMCSNGTASEGKKNCSHILKT